MNQTNPNRPADTVYLSGLKAVIWGNPRKDGNGTRYSTEYIRSYRDEATGEWKDSRSFSELENYKLSRLIAKAQDRVDELKAADRAAAKAEQGGQ